MSGAAVVALGFVTLGGIAPTPVSASAGPEVVMPTKVDNFRLTDANLQSHELYRMADAKAVVILTQADGCPVSRNTAATLKALKEQYAGKGVEFMMLNSSTLDTAPEVLKEAKEYGYDVPILGPKMFIARAVWFHCQPPVSDSASCAPVPGA